MSEDNAIDVRIVNSVDTNVKNWDQSVRPPFVKSSTIRTYIIDPANPVVDSRRIQITDYEPKRVRMALYVIDAAIAVTNDVPIASPDTSTASTAPQGGYLPVAITPYEFFGPDAFWINALSAVTRVTVIKEYC